MNPKIYDSRTWFTIVSDKRGLATIKVAVTEDERMAHSFNWLKTELKKSLLEQKALLLSKLSNVDTNIQGLDLLTYKDAFKPATEFDSRALH